MAAHDSSRRVDGRNTLGTPLLIGCGGIFLAAFMLLMGLSMGYVVGRWSADDSSTASTMSFLPTLDEHSETDPHDAESSLYPDFDLFWEAMGLLYRDFYGDRPNSEEATYAAIRSVLDLLDDPNTSFLTPDEAEFFRTHIEGSFEGIGARVGWDEEADTVVITEPFENQPAWKAGIRRDDLILAVDGESVVGTDVATAVQLIRGPEGSTVVLTIVRGVDADPFDVEVVRDVIEIPTITTDMLGEAENIGYVRLNAFNENAGQLVRQAVDDAMDRDAAALILDLRGNSGGLLREAVKVTSVFLEDEVVLLERFSDGTEETYRTAGRALVDEVPIVVLVNGGSASASEIVAGALQDTGRATLIGETTFGKGSVQLPHTMTNGAIMRVTVARWYTPLDRSIDGVGLEPDITVEVDPDAEPSAEDLQLDAALEHLLLEIGE